MCAHAVSVGLGKVDGVESAKVSLNEGLARIQLRPGNSVTMEQLREIVEQKGFTPQGATVTVRAEVIATGGDLQLKVTGTDEIFAVADTPGAARVREEVGRQVGRTVLVDGVILPPKDKKARLLIQVVSVRSPGA